MKFDKITLEIMLCLIMGATIVLFLVATYAYLYDEIIKAMQWVDDHQVGMSIATLIVGSVLFLYLGRKS